MNENDALREKRRASGQKGAAATKRQYADDPTYFQSLGKRGGFASGISRRVKPAARSKSTPEPGKPCPLQCTTPQPAGAFQTLANRPDIKHLAEAITAALEPGLLNS
jgi:general stress protein YciG